jgi:hypothetical protein
MTILFQKKDRDYPSWNVSPGSTGGDYLSRVNWVKAQNLYYNYLALNKVNTLGGIFELDKYDPIFYVIMSDCRVSIYDINDY